MENPWLKQIVSTETFAELSKTARATYTQDRRCILCRGTKMLCGKARCPVLVRAYAHAKTKPLIDSVYLGGSSPPAVFVGRIGYPYVHIGPLIPPLHGDTSFLDTPELWRGKTIEDIVDFRAQLIRGKYRVRVTQTAGKIIDEIKEMALSSLPAEIEAEFTKKPTGRQVLGDDVQPFGPSAPLKKLSLGTIKIDSRVERAYIDTDMNAKTAVLELYRSGVLVSKIQRAFSMGAFGLEKNRKFVPTRWSITAVDSLLSKDLVEKIKSYSLINEYEMYESEQNDRRFIVLFIPMMWSYELIEAWHPGTVWNPGGIGAVVFSSSEPYEGRTKYADIGGCYYAARLAVSENLSKRRRQASAVVFSEARSGYIMPVGVWHVRECVRLALICKSKKFSTLEESLAHIGTRLDVPTQKWINNSCSLRNLLYQRRIEDYSSTDTI